MRPEPAVWVIAAGLVPGCANDVLIHAVSASGVPYTSEQHRLHTKGGETLLDTLYDRATHRCAAADFPGH